MLQSYGGQALRRRLRPRVIAKGAELCCVSLDGLFESVIEVMKALDADKGAAAAAPETAGVQS